MINEFPNRSLFIDISPAWSLALTSPPCAVQSNIHSSCGCPAHFPCMFYVSESPAFGWATRPRFQEIVRCLLNEEEGPRTSYGCEWRHERNRDSFQHLPVILTLLLGLGSWLCPLFLCFCRCLFACWVSIVPSLKQVQKERHWVRMHTGEMASRTRAFLRILECFYPTSFGDTLPILHALGDTKPCL